MTGDLRIGLKESLVEEAIAKAYGVPSERSAACQHAAGRYRRNAAARRRRKTGRSQDAAVPSPGFMLASPAESAEEALSYFENALVEDKYDGIRAQAHCSRGEVRIFSRTRDEITESFPELPDALAGLPDDVILDGEIVAWSYVAGRTRLSAASARRPDDGEAGLATAGRFPSARCSSAWDERKSAKTDARRCRWPTWSSTCSTRAANCCWTAPCASAAKFWTHFWQRRRSTVVRRRLAQATSSVSHSRHDQRIEHPRDSRARISRAHAARTRSTVRSRAGPGQRRPDD